MPLDQVQEKMEKKLQPCSQKEGRSLLLNSPGHMESSSQGSSTGGSAEISNRNIKMSTNGSRRSWRRTYAQQVLDTVAHLCAAPQDAQIRKAEGRQHPKGTGDSKSAVLPNDSWGEARWTRKDENYRQLLNSTEDTSKHQACQSRNNQEIRWWGLSSLCPLSSTLPQVILVDYLNKHPWCLCMWQGECEEVKSFACKRQSPFLAGATFCSVTLLAALTSPVLTFATLVATGAGGGLGQSHTEPWAPARKTLTEQLYSASIRPINTYARSYRNVFFRMYVRDPNASSLGLCGWVFDGGRGAAGVDPVRSW